MYIYMDAPLSLHHTRARAHTHSGTARGPSHAVHRLEGKASLFFTSPSNPASAHTHLLPSVSPRIQPSHIHATCTPFPCWSDTYAHPARVPGWACCCVIRVEKELALRLAQTQALICDFSPCVQEILMDVVQLQREQARLSADVSCLFELGKVCHSV
jgi:hypothetical protein